MLVGFAGLIGSGKTTAALHLCSRHGFSRERFAGPLKDMVRALGLSDGEVEGALKEEPCAVLGGRTPRWAMQTLGTEWGRDLIHPNIWVNAWRRRVRVGEDFTVDDVRFPNEATAVRSLGGFVVQVIKTNSHYEVSQHSSEHFSLSPEVVLYNDSDVAGLHHKVDELLHDPWLSGPRRTI